MHIHTAQASALGNAMAGAQDAETAMSLRRARELRDAATKLRAASFDMSSSILPDVPTDPETAAQTVSMITAWSGGGSAQSSPSMQERASADAPPQASASEVQQTQQVQRTPPAGPVSCWA